MGFMDYSDNSYMYIICLQKEGQKTRMDAVFTPGEFRATMTD